MTDYAQASVTIVTLLTPVFLGILAYLTLRLNAKQNALKLGQEAAVVQRIETDKKVAEVSAKADVIKASSDGMKDALVNATDRMARAEGKAEGKDEGRAEAKADAAPSEAIVKLAEKVGEVKEDVQKIPDKTVEKLNRG